MWAHLKTAAGALIKRGRPGGRNRLNDPLTTRIRASRHAGAWVLVVALLGVPGGVGASLPLDAGDGELPTLAPMLREVTPAVVNISVKVRAPAQQNPLLRDPFFRRFFEGFPGEPRARPQQSAGSGVVVDADNGYVLTNNHVVENAEEIVVTLKDRRELRAELLGTDPGTDIALLKVEGDGLMQIELADSDALRVGDFVIAIGNPFGLGQTVTSGIVSALGRSGLNIEGYEDFIQTDASINPGNSGGALVNLRGELVGINTAILGPGGNIGIGFAVPSNMARAVMAQLIEYGEVRRGRLGVLIQDLTPDLADALGVDARLGAVITRIESDSPAEEAGLEAGDVVVAVDGRPVDNSADLRNRIGLKRVGEEVTLTVLREGKRKTITARIGETGVATYTSDESAPQLAGAVFQNMSAEHPLYGQFEGVVVAAVEPGSRAWNNGLRPGDVIVAVNRARVTSVGELTQALRATQRAIALDIVRGNTRLFIVIQ